MNDLCEFVGLKTQPGLFLISVGSRLHYATRLQ